MPTRCFFVLFLVAVGAGLTLPAQTARTSLYHRLELNLSLTGIIPNTYARIDASDGALGTRIDAEEHLGLASLKLEPRGVLRWRPGRRHELELGYQVARRTAVVTLDRSIDFGDSTYEAGATVESRLDTDQAFIIYRLAFLAKDGTQIGLGLGLGAMFLGTDLDVLAEASGDLTVQYTVSESFIAPLASLGVFARFLAGDRWYFEVDARYLALGIDRYKTGLFEAGAAARYSVSRHVHLEAGYGGTTTRFDMAAVAGASDEDVSASGRVEYSLQNVRLGVVLVP